MSLRKLSCPICKRPVASGDPEFPFCSDRCRTQDLANWADDKYIISGARPTESQQIGSGEIEDEIEGPDL